MRRPSTAGRLGLIGVVAATTVSMTLTSAPALAQSAPTDLAERLVSQSTLNGANRHLVAFQRIADKNGGNRAANTPGYDESVEYVAGRLRAAGYAVTTPEFTYEEEVIDVDDLLVGDDTFTINKMAESIETDDDGVTGPLVVLPDLDVDATPGCEASDFAGLDVTGGVALIRRGACAFELKALNAAAAGAVATVVANNVPGPLTNVTITNEGPIPVGGISQEDGNVLATRAGEDATVIMQSHIEERTSRNVIAQTRTGDQRNVVMAGAHLDSVEVGPGINDNGTGSAGLLEVALRLGGDAEVNNAVRFAWWGAEELGLLGSEAYVQGLTFEEQLDIALYLNFDMIGSPNAGYFVYDGDDSDGVGAGAGPYGSDQIEQTFVDFFEDRLGVPTQGTDFSGRSDYGEFIANGIPAGGLFTGAEGIKTEEQAALWGGQAGVAYDPCYHAACDNLGNVDRRALDRNLDAVAWSVGVYGYSTEDINGVPPRSERAEMRSMMRMSQSAEHSHELTA